MKLNTDLVDGMKVLNKIPTYLQHTNILENDKIIEMGTLGNFKRAMAKYADFTDCNKTSSMRYDARGWAGVSDFTEYQNLLENGDADVMKKMKVSTTKNIADLTKKYEDVINAYKFDVTGQFFDIGLVLTGVPEAWLEPEHEEEEKVQVDIIINGTFNASMSKDKVVTEASRILAITKILEDHGVQVSLQIVACIEGYTTKKTSKNLYVSTNVKDYDEPINYAKISALLTPTYLRRGVFKVMEVVAGNSVGYGYGYPKSVKGFIEMHHSRDVDALEKRLFTK